MTEYLFIASLAACSQCIVVPPGGYYKCCGFGGDNFSTACVMNKTRQNGFVAVEISTRGAHIGFGPGPESLWIVGDDCQRETGDNT